MKNTVRYALALLLLASAGATAACGTEPTGLSANAPALREETPPPPPETTPPADDPPPPPPADTTGRSGGSLGSGT